MKIILVITYFNRLLTAILLLCLSQQIQAQNLKQLLQGTTNLNEVKYIANQYFSTKVINSKTVHHFDDNEYVKYQRFEWQWKHRVMPDGGLPDYIRQHKIYQELQQQGLNKKSRSNAWRNISQTVSTSGYNGMGRVAAVAFHPTDTNIIFVGVNKGGIWKTTTGGNSWVPLGDQLPYCSVGNIVVDKVNPSVIYITIGLNEGWWHFGLGVYKSTNGGVTWNATSQSGNFTDQKVYYKLIAHPDSNNVLYSAQSDGLWKTTNAGTSWVKIRNGLHRDIEFKPFHSNTFYVAGDNELYKTIDGGYNFTQLTTFGTATNIELSVTPADSNYIGFGTDGNDFYLSTDGGNSPFVLKNSSIDDNNIIQFSHLNKDRVYCGYVTNYRSITAGTSWVKISNWYNDGVLPAVHADNHYSDVNPLNNKYIYVCNDGGLYKLNELTNEWTDLSNGLIITEFYKIALSAQDSVFMIGGTQDNGGRKRVTSTTWDATNGGDGMEVAINPTNDETIYTTYWGGTLYRSYDKWINDTYTDISADTNKGAWVTPYMLDPNSATTLLAGYADVWRSIDEGDTWTKLSTNLTGNQNNKLEILDVAKSNSAFIYTGYNEKLYVTNNGGVNWVNKTIPDSSGTFEDATMVMVHPKNENIIYVTKSGYGNHSKVYKSENNGTTWTNISYNIPNVPANCIQIDIASDSLNYDLYIGTDVGVFYKKDSDLTWQYFGSGLPNTQVSDLEIFYPTGKLRAGTYGRGIWETDIARHITPLSTSNIHVYSDKIQLLENPVQNNINLSFSLAETSKIQFNVFDESGRLIKTISDKLSKGNSTYSLDISSVSSGIYILGITGCQAPINSFKIIKK